MDRHEHMFLYGLNLTVINPWHKVGEQLIANWQRMSGRDLNDIYKRPSNEKKLIWQNCQRICQEFNGGTSLRCGNANAYQFSVAFWATFPDGGQALVYMTRCHNYIVL